MNEQQFLYQHPPFVKWEVVGQQFDQYAIFLLRMKKGDLIKRLPFCVI